MMTLPKLLILLKQTYCLILLCKKPRALHERGRVMIQMFVWSLLGTKQMTLLFSFDLMKYGDSRLVSILLCVVALVAIVSWRHI